MSDPNVDEEMKALGEAGFEEEQESQTFEDDEDILGGFPGSFGPDSLQDEPEEEVTFEGFADEDDETSDIAEEAAELLEGIDVEEVEPDEFADFEEEEGAEDEDTDPDPLADLYEDEGDDEEEEGAENPLRKYIKPAAAALAAVALGVIGYTVVIPMFSGGTPQVAVQPKAPINAPVYTPNNNQAPAIPGSVGQTANNTVPGLPSEIGNVPRVQSPGLPIDIDPDSARPDFTGSSDVVLNGASPSFETPVIGTQGSIQPEFSNEQDIWPENTGSSAEHRDNELEQVVGKIDSLLTKFDEFEEKFVSRNDVASMIAQEIKKIPAPNGPTSEDVANLQSAMEDLSARIAKLENSQASPDDQTKMQLSMVEGLIEKRFAQVESRINEQEEKILKATTPKIVNAPAPKTTTAKQETPAAAKKVKAASSETKRLKARVRAQQREIAALKARGGGVVPQAKPNIMKAHRLAGMSHDKVWIESSAGVSMYMVGQEVPGAGKITEIRRSSSNPSVITTLGVIAP